MMLTPRRGKLEWRQHSQWHLTGQNKTYLVDSMIAFQDDDRTNDIYSRMRDISRELTEAEIEALAEYYAAYLPDEE